MADDQPKYLLAARCAAEAVGTFTIVAGGCGAVSAARYAGGPPIAASAFSGSVMIVSRVLSAPNDSPRRYASAAMRSVSATPSPNGHARASDFSCVSMHEVCVYLTNSPLHSALYGLPRTRHVF